MLGSDLRQLIYWVGLGAGLVVYAHSNFATARQLEKVEGEVRGLASKEDVKAIDAKLNLILGTMLDRVRKQESSN
jgi:hypothetical protein